MTDHIIPFHKPPLSKKDLENVLDSLIAEDLLTGKICHTLETSLAETAGRKYAVSVNSFTAAFHLIWVCLNLQSDDEVIIPSYYNAQVLNSLNLVQAKTVVLDFDRQGFFYNEEQLMKSINEHTRALVAPHMYGDTRIMPLLEKIKANNNIAIIEDLSHCFGYKSQDKSSPGSFGSFSIISLVDDAIITTGNGASVFTDSQKMYLRLKDLRSNEIKGNFYQKGIKENEMPYEARFDYRLADFQAALALAQIKNLLRFNQRRNEIAEIYRKSLVKTGHRFLHIDEQPLAFRFPIILASDAETALARLRKERIKVRYRVFHPIHKILGLSSESFFQTERLYNRLLEIPLFPQMTKKDVDRVIQVFAKIS
jgi:dTDP-4-amino-4,6-dideoxygalactose transaminase